MTHIESKSSRVREFVEILGGTVESAQALLAAKGWPVQIQDDPPLRKYVYAREHGVAFLAEQGQIIDVQIYLLTTKTFSAFQAYPFGLRGGLSQEQVHNLLGPPSKASKFDSRYPLQGLNARLFVGYRPQVGACYMSVGFPPDPSLEA